MTDEEIKKISAEIEKAEEEVMQWWNSLSEEEKKKEHEKANESRLWEDWSDCDPVANALAQKGKK